MRLTADLLLRAENYLNACMERELNLRGYKIPAVENLSVLQDQFDLIDFSDNDIKKLDSFPTMKRLNTLLMNQNSISRVGGTLGKYLVGLKALVLTNNNISSLSEIDNIATVKTLETLSLLGNHVASKPNYRLYVIFKIPSIKYLDFTKVKQTEREEAAEFFQSAAGKAFSAAVAQEGKFIAEAGSSGNGLGAAAAGKPALVLTDEQKAQVKAAIERAVTKEEIDIIERELKRGNLAFLLSTDNSKKETAAGEGTDGTINDSKEQHAAGAASQPAATSTTSDAANGKRETAPKSAAPSTYESSMDID